MAIATGYHRYAQMSHVFSAWVSVVREEAEQRIEELRENTMVFKACSFFAETGSFDLFSEETQQSEVLKRLIFARLKRNFEQIRDFKIRVAERMLRSTLLGFQNVVYRHR